MIGQVQKLDRKSQLPALKEEGFISPHIHAAVEFTYAPDGFFNVGTMATEGGTPQQMTFTRQFVGFLSWSPDGNGLAFQMKQGDEMQIRLMPSEGGAPAQLASDHGDH